METIRKPAVIDDTRTNGGSLAVQNDGPDPYFEALPIERIVADFDAPAGRLLDLGDHPLMDPFVEPAAAEYQDAGQRAHSDENHQGGQNAQQDSAEFPHLKTASI